MIEVSGLEKSFGERAALAGVSFTVRAGEIYAYLGPNGAGKTTTIRILTGLSRRDGGTVRINGHDLDREPLACKALIGLVPQQTNLDADLSVEENLIVHGLLHHMERREISRKIGELLDYLEMGERRQAIVKNLPGRFRRFSISSLSATRWAGMWRSAATAISNSSCPASWPWPA